MMSKRTQLRYVAIGYQRGTLRSKGNAGKVVIDVMEPLLVSYPCEAWLRGYAMARADQVERIDVQLVERYVRP